jgi:hypothetical protein
VQDRDPLQGAVHQHGEVLPVLLQQRELEGVGDLVRAHPRLGLRLEAAHDQTADLLLEVGPSVGVTQDRQVGTHAVHLVGHHVEVLARVQRHAHPGHGTHLRGPLAGAVDHHLGLHVAGVGPHPAHGPVAGEDVEHAGALEDPGAAHPGALGERRRQVGGVRTAVAGQPDGAEQVVDRHHRPALERLGRRQHGALEPEGLRGGRGAPQLGHSVLGARHDEATALPVAGRQPRLLLEPLVQLSGVLHEAGAALGGAQLSDEAGRVPRRTAGEAALLEQQDVGPAEPGQVVGGAGADHAAAHDHDPSPRRQTLVTRHWWPPPGAWGTGES